ncbi:hypothetical protein [Ferruginibacter sp. SUN106]|uniref:hypothetical protein n=1 Tax=Ferruginibacter sp. SUN106 TaxID=2978348 RepID=UPI003D36809E
MTIIPTNILLEQLIQEENSALAWDDKLFKIHSAIKTTREIADAAKLKYPLPENYLIKRKRKLQTALSVLMAGIFTFIFGYILLTKFSTGALLVSTILLSLIYYVLFKNLTVKDLNFEIQLSKKGIEIDGKFYQWTEIQETFLVYRPNGKNRTIYFVIGLKNGFLDRYHMNNLLEFNLNERTLSALIEAYRGS